MDDNLDLLATPGMTTFLLTTLLFAPVIGSGAGAPALALEWREFGSTGDWVQSSGPSAEFFELRIRGEAATYSGTWVELAGNVWFDEDFFRSTRAQGLQMFLGPTSPYDEFRSAPVPFDLVQEGYNVPSGVEVPLCILAKDHYDAILGKNGVQFPNSISVLRFSEPLLGVTGGETEAIRVWDLQYGHWASGTLEYWREVNGVDFEPTLISRDALVKRWILDQAPHLDTDFFTSDTWEVVLETGLNFQVQGVTMVGGDIDPLSFPTTDDDPPGLVGTWTATGTTTELPSMFFSYGGQGFPFPPLVASPWQDPLPIQAGQSGVLQMTGLRKGVYARWDVSNSNQDLELLLSAGDTVKDAVFTVPANLSPGTTLKLKGFHRPAASEWSPLPNSHSLEFIVVR